LTSAPDPCITVSHMRNFVEPDVFALHAEICKTFAHPKRLQILNALRSGERSVTELLQLLQIPKANLSQHLAVLRARGVVVRRRKGANVLYAVSNPKIIRACDLMREVLTEQLHQESRAVRRWRRG